MRAIILLLLKGFWLARGKFALCVTAAVLSTWGISTMIYGFFLTQRDFEENFSKSYPADIVLSIRNVSDELVEALRTSSLVAAVERREVLTGRIRNVRGSWMSFLLFVVEDPDSPRVGKFMVVERNALPAGESAVLIEKNGRNFLPPGTGKLTVLFPGAEPVEWNLGGLVHDAGQAPSQMEQAVYGFASLRDAGHLLKTDVQRYLLRLNERELAPTQLADAATAITRLVEEHGGTVVSVNIPPPGEHPHQNIVNGISFLQRSFGLILSLLGVILLSLILITWLYPQLKSVGIMKALGASSPAIAQAYLMVLTLLIALGLLIGMPAGYASAKMYSGFIAFVQNFDVVRGPLPWRHHVYVIVPSILLPLLATIIPLLEVSKTSVQLAMNEVFYTPYKRVFTYTQFVVRNTKIKYSLNNFFRSNQRTFLMTMLLMVGYALFITGSNLGYSIRKDIAGYVSNSGYNITVSLKDSLKGDLSFLQTLPFVEAVTYVKRNVVMFQSPQKSYAENSVLTTYSPDYKVGSMIVIQGAIKAGCEDCLYLSQKNAADFEGVSLGDPIDLKFENGVISRFIYTAVIKDITHPSFYRIGRQRPEYYSEIGINMKSGFQPEEATAALDKEFLSRQIAVRQVSDAATRLAALENHLKPTYIIIQAMGASTLIISLFGLIIILNLSLQERAREVGIMKSLGSPVRTIVNLFQREYFLLNLIAVAGGTGISLVLTAVICELIGIMLLNVGIAPIVEWKTVLISAVLFPAIQWLVIDVYGRSKVRKSSGNLLTQLT